MGRRPKPPRCPFFGEGGVMNKKQSNTAPKIEYTALWERFYAAYPRKEAPAYARACFERLNPDDKLVSTMIAWLHEAKRSIQWQDKALIPMPATWLNQKRWLGEPPPMAPNIWVKDFGSDKSEASHQGENEPEYLKRAAVMHQKLGFGVFDENETYDKMVEDMPDDF